MNFCFNCGTKLSIGKEKFCPECGINFGQTGAEHKDTATSIGIKDTKGDVFGVGSSGSGNIFGKNVGYIVQENVILNISSNDSKEVIDNFRKIFSVQTQLPATVAAKGDHEKDVTNLAEFRETQQNISAVLQEVKQIGKKEGTHIQKIQAGDLQISTDDLFVKDALARGTELFYNRQYSDALEWYEKAIAKDPKNAEAWYNKGLSLGNLGKEEDEIKSYDKAIKIKPDYGDAWNNKGFVFAKLGKLEESIKYFEKAIKIKPDYAGAWYNKGLSLWKLGKHEESIKYFEKAIEIKPDLADPCIMKGLSLDELGKYDEAIKAYDKAIEINPNYAGAWYNKGSSLERLGKYEEARRCYDKALQIDPTFSMAQDNLNSVLKKSIKKKGRF